MKLKFTITVFVLLFPFLLYSQEPPKVKFEKVSEEELKMQSYDKDTTAEAVILYDEGYSEVVFDVQKGNFELRFSRFVRLKILKQNGTNWANFSIPLYSYNSNKEEIHGIKGTTLNFENGKTIKTELKKESISKERENKYYEMTKIAMPSVRVGSVIDLKYEIVSTQIWNLRSWKFQYNIPVVWSLCEVKYPEYFHYNQSFLGYYPLLYQKNDTKVDNISFSSTVRSSSSGFSSATTQFVNNKIDYIANIFSYAAKDVPAIKNEPFVTTIENYTTKVEYELASVNFTKLGGKYESYTTSWKDIVRELVDDEDFGGLLRNTRAAGEVVKQIAKNIPDTLQKIDAILTYVQKNIKWDETYSFYPTKSIKKIIDDKKGNSADINLLLNAMLVEAGIESDPVMLSTRNHGIIHPSHASRTDCNYLITRAVVKNKPILLDATEPFTAPGLIPFRCLNGSGALIRKDNPLLIDITNPKSEKSSIATLEFKDGVFTGKLTSKYTGNAAMNMRQKVKDNGGFEEYFNKLKNNSTAVKYDNYNMVTLDSIKNPVVLGYDITMPLEGEKEPDFMYINPILDNKLEKNPFISPKREFPVDFGYPFTEVFQLVIKIPAGYSVEELPKQKLSSLSERAAMFNYQASKNGDYVYVTCRLVVDKPLFLPAEYENLKALYDIIVSKQQEQIVFKKM